MADCMKKLLGLNAFLNTRAFHLGEEIENVFRPL
jgi:hypothetical protein